MAPAEAGTGNKIPMHTSGSFWGGTVMPFWVFLLFTAFPITGLLGIDHLLFRSPSTAIVKGLTNILTLGLWYFYDMIQAFTDKKFIADYGLSKPIVGPAGLALDYFSGMGQNTEGQASPMGFISVLIFIIYSFSIFIPFGISNFIAGDVNGGIAKFLMSFGPWGLIWIPFLFVAAFYESYLLIAKTQDIFEKGVVRVPPISYFMDKLGFASRLMNPASQAKAEAAADGAAAAGIYPFFIKPFLKFFGITDPMEVIDTTKCAVLPPIKESVEAAQTAGKGILKLSAKVPEIATKATEKLTAFTDPDALKAMVQKGGALKNTSSMDTILVAGMAILVIGGLGASILRKMELNRRETSDDSPPNPRAV